jgi:putative ABC transport system permease protein
MRVARNLRLSLRALSTHRVRTALAIAGTAVGVGGVVVLTAIGEGARAEVIGRIERLGRNMFVVTAARVDPRADRRVEGEGWTRELRVEDAFAILRGARGIIRAAPAQDRGMIAKFGRIATPATVLGTTPEWQSIRQFPIARGRFFTDTENSSRARVAVLGSAVHASLFPDSIEPLGRTIRIGYVPFVVVGVLASKGVSVEGSATEDDRIVVPLETARYRLFNLDYLKMIYLEAASGELMTDAAEEAAAILRVRHDVPVGGRDDFVIQNQRVILATELEARTSFRRLIMGLGFLSLLVAGTGILSIMLLSVSERRREIGLRVAVGARRPDIVVQFLAESLVLASVGGAFGIVLGVAAASVVSLATKWNAQVSPGTLAIAVTSTIAVGICSGALPAWRAAVLDPIEAIRSE